MQPQLVTVTSKGQLVIPAKLRRKFGLRKGARVAVVEEDHRLILQPVTTLIDSIWGSLKRGPSMTEALLEARRRDFESEERKIKRLRARR